MSNNAESAVTAVQFPDLGAAERWFELIGEAYTPDVSWDELRSTLIERGAASVGSDSAAAFVEYAESLSGDPLDTFRDIADDTARAFHTYAAAQASGGEEDGGAAYDPATWYAFLAENGPRWDGAEERWQSFVAWFLYEAWQQGVGVPAQGFIDYVEEQPDKVGAFAAYGVTIAAPATAQTAGQGLAPGVKDAIAKAKANPNDANARVELAFAGLDIQRNPDTWLVVCRAPGCGYYSVDARYDRSVDDAQRHIAESTDHAGYMWLGQYPAFEAEGVRKGDGVWVGQFSAPEAAEDSSVAAAAPEQSPPRPLSPPPQQSPPRPSSPPPPPPIERVLDLRAMAAENEKALKKAAEPGTRIPFWQLGQVVVVGPGHPAECYEEMSSRGATRGEITIVSRGRSLSRDPGLIQVRGCPEPDALRRVIGSFSSKRIEFV